MLVSLQRPVEPAIAANEHSAVQSLIGAAGIKAFAVAGNLREIVIREPGIDGMDCLPGVGALQNSGMFGGQIKRAWIVGIEDLWSTRFSPADAFQGLDGRKLTILTMSHNPDSAPHVVPYLPRLILAGHTHGGQIRVPLLGAPLLPLVDRRFDQGLFALENACQMYVSRGVGFLMRARFCCRPEVPVFVLSAK